MILSMILSFILAIVLSKLAVFFIDWRRNVKLCNRIPSIGSAHWLFGHMNQFSSLLEKFEKEKELIKFKGAKMVHTWLGPFHCLIGVVHPEVAKVLMKSTEPKPIFKDSDGYAFLKSWLGMGLLLSYGSRWERNRQLLTPAFHFDILKPYIKIYNEVADVFLNNIKMKMSHDKNVDVYNLVTLATLDTMLRCAFSYDGGIQTESNHPYVNAVNRMTTLLVQRYLNPLIHRNWIYDLTASGREYKKLTNFVHSFADEIIALRKKSLKEDPGQLRRDHLDFLDILLAAKDNNNMGLSDEDIRAEVDTFLFGGHDTTASAISWAFHHLGKYPNEQQKVFDELQTLMEKEGIFSWSNISQCQQLSLFIKESLRHTSPIPVISRYLTKPFVLEGVVFPEGTNLDICINHINNNPQIWSDVEFFRPERFLEAEARQRDSFAYVPFSAGPRNCIGQNFAMHQLKVIIARTVFRYKISLVDGFQYEQDPGIVTRAKNGIKLNFEDRRHL